MSRAARSLAAFVASICVAGCGASPSSAPGPPSSPPSGGAAAVAIRLVAADGEAHAVELSGVEQRLLDGWQETGASWSDVFAVFVAGGEAADGRPAIVGDYRLAGDTLRFHPRFPLEPGLTYRALFRRSRLVGGSGAPEDVVEARLELPRQAVAPTTVVRAVYPTSDTLPENQLKFYLHFSAPMSQGRAYDHVHLLDAAGEKVDSPFLELDEELWDRSGRRLTLFLDPGRVKRALKPHEEVGPSLLAGHRYTLRVDASWPDASGNPLSQSHSKEFRVGPPDYEPPDPQTWKLEPPPAGSRQPLAVAFPEPFDHALLHRVLWIRGPGGEALDGEIAVRDGESLWTFTPNAAWRDGEYRLVAQTLLEDLAGNSIGRPFEVDLFGEVRRRIEVEEVSVPFRIR